MSACPLFCEAPTSCIFQASGRGALCATAATVNVSGPNRREDRNKTVSDFLPPALIRLPPEQKSVSTNGASPSEHGPAPCPDALDRWLGLHSRHRETRSRNPPVLFPRSEETAIVGWGRDVEPRRGRNRALDLCCFDVGRRAKRRIRRICWPYRQLRMARRRLPGWVLGEQTVRREQRPRSKTPRFDHNSTAYCVYAAGTEPRQHGPKLCGHKSASGRLPPTKRNCRTPSSWTNRVPAD